jgi:flagellin
MKIGHNLAAANAIRNTNANAATAGKSMEKLSSGLAITNAADDAAGLAISEKMKGQIRGLDQATKNAQNGVSLVQTADGALTETTSILQRMRELANQASNDSNTAADRTAIQTEATELTAQLDNIANTTQFNTKNLLNGGAGVSGTSNVALDVVIGGTGDTETGQLKLTAVSTLATAATATRAGAFAAGVVTAGTATKTITVNGKIFTMAVGATSAAVVKAINDASLGVTATASATDLVLTSTDVGKAATLKSDATVAGTITPTNGTDAKIVTSQGSYTATGTIVTMTDGKFKGLQIDIKSTSVATFDITNQSLKMQIGANQGQTMGISINSMTATALGVDNLKFDTQDNAAIALKAIDTATSTVSSERSKLGAYQNRLTSTINNLGTISENLTSAESSVTDVDMAKEMSEYSKNNILSQASQAMLAQANQQPQQVLQLLK